MKSFDRALFMSMWHLDWFIYLFIIGLIYYFLIGPVAKKYSVDNRSFTWWRIFSFYSGLFVIFVANGTPVSDLGHTYLFSAHMFSMALMYLIMPPLIIVGIPEWIYRKVFAFRLLKKTILRFSHPLVAILLFNIFFSLYHVPSIFNEMSIDMTLHLTYHYVLIFLSFMMWWPILCPLPEMDKLSELQKMGYIFANGVLLTPACALIIFSKVPVYTYYIHAPRVFTIISPIADQQLGGILMKMIQEIVYGFALGYVFINWVKKQKKQDEDEKTNEIQGYGYLELSKTSKSI